MTESTYRRVEVSFPDPVPRIVLNAMAELCRIAGIGTVTVAGDDIGGLSLFAYEWPAPVELPDGLLHALDMLAGIACDLWERKNPTMVMWPAGYGCKPTRYEMGAPVEFDDDCYVIECYAREDYHGRNPLNPDGPRLRAEAALDKPLSRRKERGEAEYASWHIAATALAGNGLAGRTSPNETGSGLAVGAQDGGKQPPQEPT